jgi:uncharacterized membrane protein
MGSDPLFPGMVNTAGCLLPALISLGLVIARRTRSRLGSGDQLWLVVFSLALSAVLARVSVTLDAISLHLPPGATAVLCYLVWRGYYISPGLAFALTYASMLLVDVCLAKLATGPAFDPGGIGGAGWLDGLLIFPALTALAIVYANWRMAKVGRAGLFWFGQRTGGHAPEPPPGHPDKAAVAGG